MPPRIRPDLPPSPYLLATPEAAAAVPHGWEVERWEGDGFHTVSEANPARVGDRVRTVVLGVEEIAAARAAAEPSSVPWWPDALDDEKRIWKPGEYVRDSRATPGRSYYGQVISRAGHGQVILGIWNLGNRDTERDGIISANTLYGHVADGIGRPYDDSLTIDEVFLVPWTTQEVPEAPLDLAKALSEYEAAEQVRQATEAAEAAAAIPRCGQMAPYRPGVDTGPTYCDLEPHEEGDHEADDIEQGGRRTWGR